MNKSQKQLKLLIADDHPLFLKGLQEIISEEPGWNVVAEAHDGQQAIALINEHVPDIAILDINMPHRDGLEVAQYICDNDVPVAIIILTMYDDELLFRRAASFGVKGFILKDSAIDEIVVGIEAVARGETFVSPKFTNSILQQGADKNALRENHRLKLTKMEQKIIRLIADDYTSNTIAEKLFVSPKTVEHHRSNICRKLNLSGKNALLRYVLEHKAMILKTLNDT